MSKLLKRSFLTSNFLNQISLLQVTEKEFDKSILDISQMLRGLENLVQIYTARKKWSDETHIATITKN